MSFCSPIQVQSSIESAWGKQRNVTFDSSYTTSTSLSLPASLPTPTPHPSHAQKPRLQLFQISSLYPSLHCKPLQHGQEQDHPRPDRPHRHQVSRGRRGREDRERHGVCDVRWRMLRAFPLPLVAGCSAEEGARRVKGGSD
jgi:hypothetical protein